MRGWPISPRVNSPKNYDPDLLSPVEVRQISQSFIHVVTRWRSLREYSDIHGSARWAKRSDIKQAGLINQEGVYVGEWKNGSKIYTLRHNGPEHVLCYAPPRSGKGVGLVVPTMLTWPHSAVVTDLKREIYELTAGWRGTEGNNRILRF
jgi:type IV secretion system protein VirD4